MKMTVAVWRPMAGNTNGAILRMDEEDEAALIAAVAVMGEAVSAER